MFPGIGEGDMGRLSRKMCLRLPEPDGVLLPQLPFPEKF